MDDFCQECGAKIVGGTAVCHNLFAEFLRRAQHGVAAEALSMIVFDAYCMQHLEKYCVSAKSYLAHLVRLYIGVEKEQNPYFYRQVAQKLDGVVKLQRPLNPNSRGSITLPVIYDDLFGSERTKVALTYASSVWEAYRDQQGIAQQFLED